MEKIILVKMGKYTIYEDGTFQTPLISPLFSEWKFVDNRVYFKHHYMVDFTHNPRDTEFNTLLIKAIQDRLAESMELFMLSDEVPLDG